MEEILKIIQERSRQFFTYGFFIIQNNVKKSLVENIALIFTAAYYSESVVNKIFNSEEKEAKERYNEFITKNSEN